MKMRETILAEIKEWLTKIGEPLGFKKLRIRNNSDFTEIYLIGNHALQVEVDWRENNLFLYAVCLKNNKLPPKSVIYRYEDGQWCRRFLEDVYKTKRPLEKDKDRRYTAQYLFDCFTFYEQLIDGAPEVLIRFNNTGDI